MAGNSFGNLFRLTSFGESHGIAVGAIVDGCPARIELSEEDIQKELDKRKPGSGIAGTKRKESDTVRILSGVFEGKTTGTPICMIVYNEDQQSASYGPVKDKFRPGHADYAYFKKFGFYDYRGGGRSSGRETLARVAAGAIAKKILARDGIKIAGFVKAIGNIECGSVSEKGLERVFETELRCPDSKAEEKMKELVEKARAGGNSIGGIVELRAFNVPAGLGEPVFEKLDAEIAKALMGIGAVKGVEIGSGFNAAGSFGSENNDQMTAEKGKINFLSNNAGGILGGISTGQDIIARIAVKPTPSIAQRQKTVNKSLQNEEIEVAGRHDVCICPRIVPVAEAMLALALVNALLEQKARKQ